MIYTNNNLFHLSTNETSLIIHVDESNHIVCDYYGFKIPTTNDYRGILEKWPFAYGSSVISNESVTKNTSLDLISLEYSSIGKGDYNEPSIIIKNEDGYVFDFTFDRFVSLKGEINLKTLPAPHGECEELVIYLSDKIENIAAELHYFVFEKANIIARNLVIRNRSNKDVSLLKAMSMQLEMINDDYELLNLYGGWACEANKSVQKINPGIYLNDSKTGFSSNRHNPFFVIKNKEATFNSGRVFGFNLIYSGNHYEMVELNTFNKLRIQIGINPYCFEKILGIGKDFVTPIAIMSFSDKGLNGLSQNMHYFVNEHIVPLTFKGKEHPIIINNWESTMFKFNESKIVSLAKEAKKYDIELCVLDDGWFGKRDDDHAGLGDYNVNSKKLPHGLDGLAKKINKLGLKFGLWFEPEMVNVDSDLYRAHPDWAIKCKNRVPSEGRNQLVLDLTREEVQVYILKSLNNILDSANISYIKWDMNRNISDMQDILGRNGEFYHNYMIGLYAILKELNLRHPDLFIEMCASGGNRFDLGMLCYASQIWASDNTDAVQRMKIQSGLYLGYPQSVISCHVCGTTSQSELRVIPLSTRFNVACFGSLGYEFNLKDIIPVEEKVCKSQIKFYKEHRNLFQYGELYQLSDIDNDNKVFWEVISKDREEAVIGYFNILQDINHGTTILKACNFIDDAKYQIDVVQQDLSYKTFGNLVNNVSKVHINENGKLMYFISHHFAMSGEKETYVVSGKMLNSFAVKLMQEWAGCGLSEKVRVLGDFGSRLFYIKHIK